MGNYHTRPVTFRQSAGDFPLTVSLGEKFPAWGLSRWASAGLRFVPPDAEGFTLRGDKRRLVYKGRRRSHRFTILGDTTFEYDCILNREPESNIITLFMEGAENFDFFRQPDFVKDPLLKESYAVYKKETLIGEGTGKLCHIHRPLIIDALGRRSWGDLSVIGSELRITIPENWLSQAKYPVVVDPTIGTTTVGSQNEWTEDVDEPKALCFLAAIAVNRFLVPEAINGNCTAYAYCNEDDGDGGGRPVLYSDSSSKPWERRSAVEGLFDFGMNGSKPPSWRTAAFQSNRSIAAGTYLWFGVLAELYWFPRFDYGVVCYVDVIDDYDPVPDLYPHNGRNYYENFKLSMYFTYTSAQNYTRTLTQGVTLTDSRKQVADYKRAMAMNAATGDYTGKIQTWFRAIQEQAAAFGEVGHLGDYLRGIYTEAGNVAEAKHKGEYYRTVQDTAGSAAVSLRHLLIFLRLVTLSLVRDYLIPRFLRSREELVIKSVVVRELALESRVA
jgi:hypothetical protein